MMRTLKLFAVVGVAAMSLLGLSGCATLDKDGASSGITTYSVSFMDGSKVDCLWSSGRGHSDVNCLWDKPSEATETKDSLLASFQSAGGVKVRCVTDEYGSMDCDTAG
jgi:hypothetical protein